MKSIQGKIHLCMSLTVAVVLLVLGVASVYLNYFSSTQLPTAEESAATSEELSGQAQMLKELIGQFKLRQATAMDVGHSSQ